MSQTYVLWGSSSKKHVPTSIPRRHELDLPYLHLPFTCTSPIYHYCSEYLYTAFNKMWFTKWFAQQNKAIISCLQKVNIVRYAEET